MGMIARAASPSDEPTPPFDAAADLAAREAKSLLHISYAGSPLVGEFMGGQTSPGGPAPGQRYPDRIKLTGPLHHLLVFGPSPEGLDTFADR